ncbi:MAG: class I SAM-dependent methyltransferase, partial [Acidobacteria bacterium]|nr:class I SAM-dependent methyltransferase [Acidobacteriota bacterium]
RFLAVVDDGRIEEAARSLRTMLGRARLDGLSFLDIGSGSGLFSLAARRLGARVVSFDYDPESVACTRQLKRRYFTDDPDWSIAEASVLDPDFMTALGPFDVVYAFGSLHHTGDLWKAMELAANRVATGGVLHTMIYLDRGLVSVAWRAVKRAYCSSFVGRIAVLAVFVPYFAIRGGLEDLCRLKNPLRRYTDYRRNRGMSGVHDWIDWLGGYPYEFAKPAEVIRFMEARGFVLERQKDTEYVFRSVAE